MARVAASSDSKWTNPYPLEVFPSEIKMLDYLFEFYPITTSITFIDDFAGQDVSEWGECIVQHFIRDVTYCTTHSTTLIFPNS